MRELGLLLRRYIKGVDLLLLVLCVAAAAFGCVLISSAARPMQGGASSYVRTQVTSIIMGIAIYLAVSAISLDWLASLWKWILPFNILFILLLVPFGHDFGSGNKSWLQLPGIPFYIQAAEVVKITFILLLAVQMYYLRERINHVIPVASFVIHTVLMVGLIQVISSDTGVALIYVAILLAMMVGAGIKPIWFLLGAGAAGAVAPLVWTFLTDRQRQRIIITLNPQMDPQGTGWHAIQSMKTLGGGKMLGQGLYQGTITQAGTLYGARTDFIFSVCGEELGYAGCLLVLALLTAIIIRCLTMARRARNGFGALVCFGVAGMVIFQTFENVGMCMGLTPIIGITLPFFSYGGSSNIVLFTAMGLVSSVRFHPKKTWLDY